MGAPELRSHLSDLAARFSNPEGVAAAIKRSMLLLLPPPDVLPSEWAEGNVYVPVGNALPGPIRFDNAPYQVEPMDQLVNPDCYRVTLMWGAQVGKTMLALCVQDYCIEVTPLSQMMMQPSQGDLTTWLETKFNPLVESSKGLKRRIAKPRGRDGVNNQKMKSYPGGFLMFAWSGSPKTMRGRSAPVIVCDEVDGYENTKEGHPVSLLWQRAATFGDQRFLLEISTPTLEETSYIEKAFLAGDQRRFYVCCPDCGEHQPFVWENVHWIGRQSTGLDDADKDAKRDDHQPETARYRCSCCASLWDDGQRVAAIRSAVSQGAGWKASKPFRGHASYHLNEIYSTLVKLRTIVQSYLDKLANDDLQTFVNVSLSMTWAEKGEKPDASGLMARAEDYPAQVPAGALHLTAGIDMQTDRLEVEVVGWGEGEESWSIDYQVLWGDPLLPDVWQDLDDLLAGTYLHESGKLLPISAACLDTGGTAGYTQAAYDYAKGKTGRRLFAVKGQGGWNLPVVGTPQRRQSGKKARKVDLFIVGTDQAKLTVMRRLGKKEPGPGYCHFPKDRPQEWFDQVTAEKLIVHYVKGQPVRTWTKGDKDRNEALDCRVYAYAALKINYPSFKRLAERLKVPEWRQAVAARIRQLTETPQKESPMPKRNHPKRAPAAAPAAPMTTDEIITGLTALARLKQLAAAGRAQAQAAQAEKPQEEGQADHAENPPTMKPKRTLKTQRKRGNWATKW